MRGRVQGVGFRYTTMEQARRLGLTGWVGNRHDGSVEFLVQGRPSVVDAMLAFLGQGPRAARVDSLHHREVAPDPALTSFRLG